MQKLIAKIKKRHTNKSIGFVPTMGALHKGHISLFRKSVKDNDISIVSIYVNKTQFNDESDFAKYPKTLKQDLRICKKNKIDIVFAPQDLYFGNSDNEPKILPSTIAKNYEGAYRVGHFVGMLRVVMKLLNITSPTRAYFGKKDAQQLCLVKQMAKVFFLPTKIMACKCVREPNGLAISSRNRFIRQTQMQDALKLSKALFVVRDYLKKNMLSNAFDATTIRQAKKEAQKVIGGLEVEYFDIVDECFTSCCDDDLDVGNISGKNIIAIIAVRLDGVRLIDSLWIKHKK